MNPLFQIPEDFAALTVDELNEFIATARETAAAVGANPAEFTAEGRDLIAEMTDGVAAIEAARAELAARSDEEPEVEVEAEAALEVDTDALAELAARASAEDEVEDEPEAEVTPEPDPEATAEPEALAVVPEPEAIVEPEAAVEPEAEPVVAAAAPARRPRPARSRAAVPQPQAPPHVALVAAAENLGVGLGQEVTDPDVIARMMMKRRGQFGHIAEGTHGEQIPIVRADYAELYPEDRTLDRDFQANQGKIDAVVNDSLIREAFGERRKAEGSLTASGGLCAPVTNYYGLQMLSVADRPVRGALPAFNADRGGINAAQPASLASITDAVGIITEAEDAAGGTLATKSCQVIDCPPFVETDVATIFHCLQFGNLGARTYPELVAQWNQLVLAAHARTAETALLDGIDSASTAVTAASMGLGASATIPSQVLAAAVGLRSRHRMRPDTVLRAMFPTWVLDLLVSDMYRTQFERFDMGPNDFVRILRAANVEPTFYIDGATGAGQVFGSQGASDLLTFPADVRWYLYPEGSFLYLDGGSLELGLVRDSVLNATNDFQIFGESFENVAFIGIESLAITSTTSDCGAVVLPAEATCPTDYANGG